MVGAIVDGRQRRTFLAEALQHPAIQSLELFVAVIAATVTRLIGNDNELITEFIKPPTSIKYPVQELEILTPEYISFVLVPIDNAVTIEKSRFMVARHVHSALMTGKHCFFDIAAD